MKYKTNFQTLRLDDIVEPPYNPREDIIKGSDEYKALRRSLEEHGLVEPPVVNLHNMRCIGGNQRLTVLRDMGVDEVLCSVIQEPDEAKEKKLCLALNRIEGRWDTDKLGDLLRDDDVLEYETGFDEAELRVYRQLEDVRDPDVDGDDDLDGLDGEDDGEYEDQLVNRISVFHRIRPRGEAKTAACIKDGGNGGDHTHHAGKTDTFHDHLLLGDQCKAAGDIDVKHQPDTDIVGNGPGFDHSEDPLSLLFLLRFMPALRFFQKEVSHKHHDKVNAGQN